MRAPKGFGKNYFSLSAILAYASSASLLSAHTGMQAHHQSICDEEEEETAIEEDDPLLVETSALPAGSRRRPCHCNLHFHRLACRRLRSHDRPKRFISPYRYTCSTLSPPKSVYPSNQNIINQGIS